MDDGDRAADLAARERASALSRVLRGRDETGEPGRENCIDCDVSIPEARREAVLGVKRCINCQELVDKNRQ